MRIGIDGRAISHPQPGGYKSYLTNLVDGLADADDENSYIIYLDREVSGRMRPEKRNFQVEIVQTRIPGRWWREQVLLPRRLLQNRVAVAHFPSNTSPMSCDCPYIVTILDAIRFLEMPQLARPYSRRTVAELISLAYMRHCTVHAAKRARRIITISQCSKRDIVNRLTVSPSNVHVIYPAPKPLYRPVEANPLVDACRRRYQLPAKFVLAFGTTAPRKNTKAVVQAYARLGTHAVSEYRLVFICSSRSARDHVHQLAKRSGIDHNVSLLTGVPDSDLALLYNAAELFVFPSLYEGFGLPPLEAMACGTPVITSSLSSLPEVVGDAAMLVDPRDQGGLSRAISDVLTHDGLRSELARRGLLRASSFNAQRQAQETLAVYRDVVSP